MASATDITMRLRDMIENDFQDGDRLPSEVKLSESLGVSRAKLREAFGSLWQAGLIEKKWGVGTIVRKPKVAKPVVIPLPYIRSTPNLIRESGQVPSVSDLSVERGSADATIADLLNIPLENEFWLIDRVVRADDIPIQRSFDAVCVDIDGKTFDASAFDVDSNTLVAMYRDQLQNNLMRSEGRVTVVPAPEYTANRLGLREEDPVLLIEYAVLTERGSIISYSVTWFNPAHVDLRFTAERPDVMDAHDEPPSTEQKLFAPSHVSAHLSALRHEKISKKPS